MRILIRVGVITRNRSSKEAGYDQRNVQRTFRIKNLSAKLQNSANNLANIQTSGFKKSTASVSEIKSGGSQVTSTTMNVQGGTLPTGNPTDLAMTVADFFRRHFLMGV
ncbi:MAG: hypothetical protein QF687_05465 [Nitrospinaceae bacterium]|nr:hypothetical protein [Nitrospinaceae bacterium]